MITRVRTEPDPPKGRLRAGPTEVPPCIVRRLRRTLRVEWTGDEAMMKTKSKRIEARVKPDTLVVVKRAAELQGSSVSEFVVSAAEKEARRALEEASTIRLSVED